MRTTKDEDSIDRLRIVAGMGGVVAVTLILLLVQLQLDSGALFGA